MKIVKDGDSYNIRTNDFVNLQESSSIFVSLEELQEFEKQYTGTYHEFRDYGKDDSCSRCGILKEKARFFHCAFDADDLKGEKGELTTY